MPLEDAKAIYSDTGSSHVNAVSTTAPTRAGSCVSVISSALSRPLEVAACDNDTAGTIFSAIMADTIGPCTSNTQRPTPRASTNPPSTVPTGPCTGFARPSSANVLRCSNASKIPR